jgi:hypothetical protein
VGILKNHRVGDVENGEPGRGCDAGEGAANSSEAPWEGWYNKIMGEGAV